MSKIKSRAAIRQAQSRKSSPPAAQQRRRLPTIKARGSPSIGEFTSDAAAEILTAARGSPSMGELTIGAPAHATVSNRNRARRTDVELIRSLAKARGWSADKLYNMPTGQVMKLLGNDLKKLEGDAYRERSRTNYRRAQGRLED